MSTLIKSPDFFSDSQLVLNNDFETDLSTSTSCRGVPMDFSLTLDDISKQFTDVKKLFTSDGPGLPVADLEMVIDADRMYSEGESRNASASG